MKTINAAAAALLVLTSVAGRSAYAQTWYFVNAQEARCQVASAPQAMREYVRQLGHLENTSVIHGADGTIAAVQVTDATVNGSILFFPKVANCQRALSALRANGTLPSPDELR